ncbi:YggS family pyridoxal phosphate-dependent enzyme [Candidatus Pelagibacter sp.]|nr:YggS family pyridoxal phosphate-dependent enzyme [Candidatus Pelagibacter sp.]|tara:strand:- start:228 stop:890 length:663 start_codon:yes stop_codon:yes gene_type:complete
MHKTIENLNYIESQINSKILKLNINNYKPKIIAISKTFKIDHILPLIEHGHRDFGENKVQEALEKWSEVKNKNKNIKLHMVGKLQTNKVKFVLPLFDFIHSLDNLKLAKKISEEQKKYENKPKIFIQVNIGNELQKSGINKIELTDFYGECVNLGLDVVGTMCLPPISNEPDIYFSEMKKITNNINLDNISMGMSEDYLKAIEYSSTYLRIGSKIFGTRN